MRLEFSKEELVAIFARALPSGITPDLVEIDFNRGQQTLTFTFDPPKMIHEKLHVVAAAD